MNDMTFTDASAVLTDVFQQATGQKVIAPTTPGEFTAVGTTLLKTGYDPILNAISQVLSRTIFSIRPYYRKFQALESDEIRYGNMVRKINFLSTGGVDTSPAFFDIEQGKSVDQYRVNKPGVLQMNFYGQTPYHRYITRFDNQLDVSFTDWQELNRFWAGVFTEVGNDIEQIHESTARGAVTNLIAGTIVSRPASVIHLLSEYNELTGGAWTSETVFAPPQFEAFTRWLFGRIATLSDFLTERSVQNHTQITGQNGVLLRHTPKEYQRFYLYSPYYNMIRASVLSNTFHEEMLRFNAFEAVNFWQSIDTPDTINAKPTYTAADGTIISSETAVEQSSILGVIFDRDAAGYNIIDYKSYVTPINAAGRYWNYHYHFTDRYWNDFTENCVVLVLD